MSFTSIDFAIFLPAVFVLYWFITNKNLMYQNLLIVVASYIFYGWWDWRFLYLLVFSSVVDFFVGINLYKQDNKFKRKSLLCISILINLGLLFFFKYFNFFLDSFVSAFVFFGSEINISSLDIILPVGISFYTFQTISYTIDVYNFKLKPTNDIISFLAYVSFFPQLVAGPIERATNLLPQFYNKRSFNYSKSVDGLKQILWGFFKKVVIADNCAKYANLIFNNSDDYTGSTLLIGACLFAVQIYGDFSGYSDIAIGLSRLFGFELMQNFSFPYFAKDIAEYWRRWHISLSTWFRDYIYIPLGGNRGSTWKKVRNTFIVFILSGLWHGANWTFIFWGALNAIYYLPLLLSNRNRINLNIVASGRYLPTLNEFLAMLSTFGLTVIAWIFFRAENLTHAFQFLNDMFLGLFTVNGYLQTIELIKSEIGISLFLLLLIFFLIEWIGREGQFALSKFGQNTNRKFRYAMYYVIIIAILWFGGEEQQFIYFQF